MGSSWSILPRLDDAFGGAVGDLAQLALAPAAVVLDVDQDARPLAHACATASG